VIIIPTILFIVFVTESISRIMTAFTIALFLFVLFSLSHTAFSDPGIVFHHEYEIDPEAAERDRVIQCAQCNVKRPSTARHCYRCGVCVDRVASLCLSSSNPSQLDHHCPFMGKCIGKKNLYSFYAFIGSVYLHTYYVLGTTAYFLVFVIIVPAARHSHS
jgi:hypothetical protein